MEIYDLRVNHLENPLGYAMGRTVFSWKVRGAVGKEQSAARIRVGVSEQLTEDSILADTGFCGELSSLAAPVDLPLKPRARYYWTVTVRTDAGEEETGEVQWFETSKMEEAWSASWITCGSDENRHPVFEKEIVPQGEVADARLYICGLGLYEAYLDGRRVGDEYLTPYCNDYNEWVQYQTYDVTGYLKTPGRLSVLLGNGWYKGRFGFNDKTGKPFYGNEWKLLAELRLTYADGRTEVIGTDETWTVRRSNLLFSNIYDGEQVDDTLAELPAEQAVCCEPPKGKLTARISTPVRARESFVPAALIKTPAGEQVFDMGQEFTGIFRLRVREPRGTKIHIQTGEVLQDGNFYNENLRSAKSEYIYVSDGREKDVTPHFTFYGYRYVKVEGIADLKKEDFTGIALYSEIPEAGRIRTGNPLVNQLISNIRWGMKGNFLDVPTDCPQRDERMGWTGDAQVFSATATYLADTWAFYRKYLYDMAAEQRTRDGKVPDVIPNFDKEGTSCVWGDAACIIPWNLYQFYGDESILRDQYESMKGWVDYIGLVDGGNHGWREHFHYGDWLALDHPSGKADAVRGGTDERFIADVYYGASAEIVAKTAEILGDAHEADQYRERSRRQFDWVRREYFDRDGRCRIRTQTACILTLKYQLSDNIAAAAGTLRELFSESGGKLRTGFVGTPLLCNVLSAHGMDGLAYHLLLNEEFPGWLYEVKLGATTVWERWNSLDENGRISSTGMNSLNHYSFGAVEEWMFRHAAGINIGEECFSVRADGTRSTAEEMRQNAGFGRVIFMPKPDRRLGELEAFYDSAAGRYQSAWKYIGEDTLRISVSVPFGCHARLVLPQAPAEVFTDRENPMFAEVRDGVCFLDAGDYTVTYRPAG